MNFKGNTMSKNRAVGPLRQTVWQSMTLSLIV